MLVKCICSNCSHSYLADDQTGGLACPRCGVDNHADRTMAHTPAPAGAPGGRDEMFDGNSFHGPGMEVRFAPQAPPPMYVTGDKLLKGFLLGSIMAGFVGAVLGGAAAAVQVSVPAVAGIALGVVGGLVCRHGFGGRSAMRTLGRTGFVVLLVLGVGFGCYVGGAWAVERHTGTADRDGDGRPDVQQTREDLDKGLRALLRERARTADAGAAALLDQRITETERVKHLSDPQLEDYLWSQKADINQPVAAYAKLRVTEGLLIRLGPDSDPVHLPDPAPLAILVGEVILAFILAMRAVMPR